jgi:exosortase/archaeosortase family protein
MRRQKRASGDLTTTANVKTPNRNASLRNRSDAIGGKRPIFQFVAVFVLLMGAFYASTFIPAMEKDYLPRLQRANAIVSTGILNLFGEDATSRETNINSLRYSISVAHGCDAIEPIALFVAAVLAFPTRWTPKLPGLLIGTLILAVMNLVRIVSLFYTGIHWPTAFETMHVDVWQPAFIVLSLFFWVLWALWATRPPVALPDAAT